MEIKGQDRMRIMNGTEHGAILQRDGKTYGISTRTAAGVVTPDHLERVAAVARKYGVPLVR